MGNGINGGTDNRLGKAKNKASSRKKVDLEEVDKLADELVREHKNSDFRKWYCGVVFEFGVERVRYWQEQARTAKYPGRVFILYVKQARSKAAYKRRNPSLAGCDFTDDITDAFSPEEIAEALEDSYIEHGIHKPPADQSHAVPWLNEED